MGVARGILFTALAICAVTTFSFGQGKTRGSDELLDIWTKRVSRVVFLGDSTMPFKVKLKNEDDESSLSQIIFKAAVSGKLTAYSSADYKFAYPQLSRKNIKDIIEVLPADTIEGEDAEGGIVSKVVKKEISYAEVRKFKVLEEWVFDIKKAKTTIQIVGIAPYAPPNIITKGGAIIGNYPLFWVRYEDVRAILMDYQQSHPNSNIPLSVWNSYFTETE
jgi:hypothetical protein